MQNSSVCEEERCSRQKLLSVARKMFHECGYAKTSMDELCTQAGLTRGALYHHFGSKSGLLEAVVVEIHDEMRARLEKEAVGGDPWTRFRACSSSYLELALEPEVQRIVFQDAPAVLGPRMSEIDRRSVEPIREVLEEAMGMGRIHRMDSEVLARILNGAWREAALWLANSVNPEKDLERVRHAVEVLLGGLEQSSDTSASTCGH